MSVDIPVLTIDGPSGAGKGTASRAVAKELGWHFLDSGAIYRSLAVAVRRSGTPIENADAIARLAGSLDLRFPSGDPPRILLNGEDIADEIPTETCGNIASRIAAYGPVRSALLDKQREFRRHPGLVADGRDMGTVVFPEAPFKVFLTASAEIRALRRYKQLRQQGVHVNLERLTKEIEERDRRDRERAEAPLIRAEGAVLIDSSELTVDQVIETILDIVRKK
jgi:cytidylate kinase